MPASAIIDIHLRSSECRWATPSAILDYWAAFRHITLILCRQFFSAICCRHAGQLLMLPLRLRLALLIATRLMSLLPHYFATLWCCHYASPAIFSLADAFAAGDATCCRHVDYSLMPLRRWLMMPPIHTPPLFSRRRWLAAFSCADFLYYYCHYLLRFLYLRDIFFISLYADISIYAALTFTTMPFAICFRLFCHAIIWWFCRADLLTAIIDIDYCCHYYYCHAMPYAIILSFRFSDIFIDYAHYFIFTPWCRRRYFVIYLFLSLRRLRFFASIRRWPWLPFFSFSPLILIIIYWCHFITPMIFIISLNCRHCRFLAIYFAISFLYRCFRHWCFRRFRLRLLMLISRYIFAIFITPLDITLYYYYLIYWLIHAITPLITFDFDYHYLLHISFSRCHFHFMMPPLIYLFLSLPPQILIILLIIIISLSLLLIFSLFSAITPFIYFLFIDIIFFIIFWYLFSLIFHYAITFAIIRYFSLFLLSFIIFLLFSLHYALFIYFHCLFSLFSMPPLFISIFIEPPLYYFHCHWLHYLRHIIIAIIYAIFIDAITILFHYIITIFISLLLPFIIILYFIDYAAIDISISFIYWYWLLLSFTPLLTLFIFNILMMFIFITPYYYWLILLIYYFTLYLFSLFLIIFAIFIFITPLYMIFSLFHWLRHYDAFADFDADFYLFSIIDLFTFFFHIFAFAAILIICHYLFAIIYSCFIYIYLFIDITLYIMSFHYYFLYDIY